MNRKMIRKKENNNIIIAIVTFLFLFFICSSFTLLDRKYFIMEKIFKGANSIINKAIINYTYDSNINMNNIINSKLKLLEDENKELKKNLELKQTNELYIPTMVINHNINNWFDKIEIYSNNNMIKKDNAVITDKGLVGFVSKTSKFVNEVNLITSVNENDMLSVMIKTDSGNIYGVLKEYDAKTNLFKVSDIISKEKIDKNSVVLLSGYDNMSYKGLKLGYVVKEALENNELTRTIWVKSDVNFNDLMYVIVVGDV